MAKDVAFLAEENIDCSVLQSFIKQLKSCGDLVEVAINPG